MSNEVADSDLQALRDRSVELRKQIAEEERKQSEVQAEAQRRIEKEQLLAENARLEQRLEDAKKVTENIVEADALAQVTETTDVVTVADPPVTTVTESNKAAEPVKGNVAAKIKE